MTRRRHGRYTAALVILCGIGGPLSWIAPPLIDDWIWANPNARGMITGSARIVDGDTLRIGAARIRLDGIDACEIGQPIRWTDGRAAEDCGLLAKSWLQELTTAGQVSCRPSGQDHYGRVIARCRSRDQDLGEALISAGHAITATHTAHLRVIRYILSEWWARLQSRGIWAGVTETPAEWRRQRR